MKNKETIIIMLVVILFFLTLFVYNYVKFTPFLSGFITSDAVDPIFTIRIVDFQSPAELGGFLKFSYFIRSVAGVNGSAEINFWLEREGKIIALGSDTVYLGGSEEKTREAQIFLPSDLKSGVYNLKLEVNYKGYIIRAYRTIEISVSGGIVTVNTGVGDFSIYIIILLILLAIFNIVLFYLLEREKIKKIFRDKKDFFKKHRFFILLLSFFIIMFALIYYLNLIGALFGIPVYFYYSLSGIIFILILLSKSILKKKSKKGKINPYKKEREEQKENQPF
jgi:hypothetical protein